MTIDDRLQWIGAVGVILGHTLNAVGPAAYPWNITAFVLGTIFFLIWAVRQINQPQILVSAISLGIGFMGLYKALT